MASVGHSAILTYETPPLSSNRGPARPASPPPAAPAAQSASRPALAPGQTKSLIARHGDLADFALD